MLLYGEDLRKTVYYYNSISINMKNITAKRSGKIDFIEDELNYLKVLFLFLPNIIFLRFLLC